MWARLRSIWGIGLLLGIYLLLGLTYSVVTPLFEAPDEPQHFFYARHIALSGRLPTPGDEGLWQQESTQPPLYYALAAGIMFPIDTSDAEEVAKPNPHAIVGVPLAPDNKNAYVHTARENFPWQGTVLAVHLVRAFSVCLGAVTVLMTYLLGLELGLGRLVSLGGASVVALLPQFLFISGAINNDNLVTAVCAVGLWLLVQHLGLGPSPKRAVLVGLVAGLAALSKLSGAAFIVLCLAAYAWQAYRRKERGWLLDMGFALATWGAVAGWWFARNLLIFGDVTGTAQMLQIMGLRTDAPTLSGIFGELRGFVFSFWGLFGWFNVLAPETMYTLLNVLALLSILGWVLWKAGVLRRDARVPSATGWLGVWTLIVTAALLRWTWITPASQGRLLFPALPAVALLLAVGWSMLGRSALRSLAMGLVAGLFFIAAVSSPFAAILPAYQLAPAIAENALPANLQRLDAQFAGAATLVGYTATPEVIHPGEDVAITLCWRPTQQTVGDYSVTITLYGREKQVLGQRNTFPGGGLLPTSLWQPGSLFCDEIHVPVAGDFAGPAVLRASVGLWNAKSGEQLAALDRLGRISDITLDVARLATETPPEPENSMAAQVGDEIALIGWSAQKSGPDQVKVILYWRTDSPPQADYTVFTHLLDENGNTVAGHDSIPASGDYPTGWWLPGEIVEDSHILRADSPIPPGEYMIEVGMYPTGAPEARLPVLVEGVEIPEERILLGPIAY